MQFSVFLSRRNALSSSLEIWTGSLGEGTIFAEIAKKLEIFQNVLEKLCTWLWAFSLWIKFRQILVAMESQVGTYANCLDS